MTNTTATRTGSWKRLIGGFHVYTNAAGRTLAEVSRAGRKFWTAEFRTAEGRRQVKGSFDTARAAKQAVEAAYREYRTAQLEAAAAEDLTRSGHVCHPGDTTTEQNTPEATMLNYHFTRTENGETVRMHGRTALAQINAAMLNPVAEGVDEMSSTRDGGYEIRYTDGRTVGFTRYSSPLPVAETPAPAAEVTVTEATGPARSYSNGATRKVTVKGKAYIVGQIVQARPKTQGAVSWIPVAYVSYWRDRGGKAFGPTQGARADAKPGTVGRAIWDAIQP